MERLVVILIFVGISIVRGLMKTAKEKAARERHVGQRADPNRKDRVQGEIEAFLSEVGGGTSEQPSPRDETGRRQEERRQKNQEKKERARRNEQEKRRQQAIQQKRDDTRARRTAETKSANAPSRKVGSGISDHVDQYINQHVHEHLDHDESDFVDASMIETVDDHLGNRAVEMGMKTRTTRRVQSESARAVMKLLKDPVGVRNAILVNEILSRPRSLRK